MVDAPDAAMAAIDVLGRNKRHVRHGIQEMALLKARGFEMVEILGAVKNSYLLTLKQVGIGNRKPLCLKA